MNVLELTTGTARVELSERELHILNNALNEVTNGIHFADREFSTRMGCSPAESQDLLAEVHGLLHQIGRRADRDP